MATTRATRSAKGFAAASVATFVALFGHVAGGGAVPGWLGIVAPLVLSSAVCVLIAGRRLSIIRLSLSVAVSQVLFHFLFVLGDTTAVVHAEGHHGPVVVASAGEASAAVTMSLGHAAAAAITIAALYFGERALRGLAELIRVAASWVIRSLDIPVVASLSPAAPRSSAWRVFVPRTLRDAASVACRRGPPALTA